MNEPLIVTRHDDTIIFTTARPLTARTKQSIRREALRWIATHPREQRGVRKYRFDHIDAASGVTVKDAF